MLLPSTSELHRQTNSVAPNQQAAHTVTPTTRSRKMLRRLSGAFNRLRNTLRHGLFGKVDQLLTV